MLLFHVESIFEKSTMADSKKRKALGILSTSSGTQTKKRWSGRMLNTRKKGDPVTDYNSDNSRLLGLPAEVRACIYRYVLCAGTLHVRTSQVEGQRPRSSVYVCNAAVKDCEIAAIGVTRRSPHTILTITAMRAACPIRASEIGLCLTSSRSSWFCC